MGYVATKKYFVFLRELFVQIVDSHLFREDWVQRRVRHGGEGLPEEEDDQGEKNELFFSGLCNRE